MKSRNIVIVTGCVILFFAYFFVSDYQAQRSKQIETATTYSDDSWGLSIMNEYLQTRQSKVRILDSFIEAADFDNIDSVQILSPKKSLSAHEAQILSEAVRRGLKLVVSFHNKDHFSNLSPIFSELGLSNISFEKNEKFKNFKVQKVSPKKAVEIFKTNENYAVYSPFVLKDEGCKNSSFGCFFKLEKFDRGQLLVVAGMAPMTNAMLGLADNMQLSSRLLAWLGETRIDEYHNYFSRKGLVELLLKWDFSLPILGLVIGTLLFFVFSKPPSDTLIEEAEPNRSFHQLNESILADLMKRPGWQNAGVDFIKRSIRDSFSERRVEFEKLNAEISKQRNAKKQILMWIDVHKKWIAERRGIK